MGFVFLLQKDQLIVWDHFIVGGEKWESAQLSKHKSKKIYSFRFCVSSYAEEDQTHFKTSILFILTATDFDKVCNRSGGQLSP